MISRHVDLIAIGVLLFAMAFYSQVRRVAALHYQSLHRPGFTTYRNSIIVVPPVPPRPQLPFTNE
ncbi:MAG: hypothetical protein JO270_20395 [Acidobacteriaceae bacterium]|nr:hypothetical protein [Acidobacteriaceae bacterium]